MSDRLRKYIAAATLALLATPAFAGDAWVAKHNLSPGDVVHSDDAEVKSLPQASPDALPTTRDLVGLEIKRRVYSGHPIGSRDVGQPTVVKVNTPVQVRWTMGDISLSMRGNALEPGGIGDQIRVLNPTTSRTIRGTILPDGTVEVRGEP